MATILETKQALSDIRNELRKEQQRGVELARNPTLLWRRSRRRARCLIRCRRGRRC